MNQLLDKIHGSLLGGMIGDAMGAPGEGLTYEQIQAKYGPQGITDFKGLGTDDTAVKHQLSRRSWQPLTDSSTVQLKLPL